MQNYLRIPFWGSVIVVGVLPVTILLPVSFYAAGVWSDLFTKGGIYFLPYLVILTVTLMYSTRYVSRRLESLAAYSATLTTEGKRPELGAMYGLKGLFVTYALQFSVIQTLYTATNLLPFYNLSQSFILSVAFIYWNFIIGTFLWVFSFSMFKIRGIGKMDLNLKPFSEDRTLGLRPFGRTSLDLTGLYLLLISLILIPQTFLINVAGPVLVFGLCLLAMGVIVFFLPLMGLHRKLVEARREALVWISPQYTKRLDKLREDGLTKADERVFLELAGIDKIQRDIGQIHSWPLDVGIITRLAAIIFSVAAILLANIIRGLLHI